MLVCNLFTSRPEVEQYIKGDEHEKEAYNEEK